jgi:hypothetical protein
MTQNILIIGNGFDLYHGLPTRYTDFLFWVKHWDDFCRNVSKDPTKKSTAGDWYVRLDENGKLIEESISWLARNYTGYMVHIFDELEKTIKENRWIKYFIKRNNTNDKWIDFENEIQTVLCTLDEIFDTIENFHEINDSEWFVRSQKRRTIIECFFSPNQSFAFSMNELHRIKEACLLFVDNNSKQSVIEDINKDLKDLIKVLRFYLNDLVSNIKIEQYSQQIENIKNPKILSFNYTDTYSKVKYYSKATEVHSIHGSVIRNNLVLGVSDDIFDDKKLDYIHFQKYYQRIQKKTGSDYLNWISPKEEAHIYIMGHSLDPVDGGVLNYFLSSKNVSKITVFCYDQHAYENMVINLIKIMGKEQTIKLIGEGRIEFVDLMKPTLISVAPMRF